VNISFTLEEKEALKLLNLLTTIDPTNIFIGSLTSTIRKQVEAKLNAEVKFVQKEEAQAQPIFGAPKK